jgi:hypothetical protein
MEESESPINPDDRQLLQLSQVLNCNSLPSWPNSLAKLIEGSFPHLGSFPPHLIYN